ncbi:sigma factor-like helix-turn-helix DNA-binding protein [Staphylococcus equorum]
MFYYQGLSQQRIANNLNTPLGTVKSQIRLSVQHLNNYLKKASRKESED